MMVTITSFGLAMGIGPPICRFGSGSMSSLVVGLATAELSLFRRGIASSSASVLFLWFNSGLSRLVLWIFCNSV